MNQHGHAHAADGSCPSGHEEDQLLNMEALQANMLGINYVRSLMAIVIGIVAGVAGLTNSRGFLFYIVMHLVTSFALLFKMKFNPSEYLSANVSIFWFAVDGLLAQLISFLMFWTLSFAMIHIF